MADDATHATCLSHTPSGQCIPVGSITAAELKERQERWLACYKRRRVAARERQRQAEACCADCADASRSDPLNQARYHRREAARLTSEAVESAGASARALLAARRANLISVAVIVVLALALLVLAVVVLVDG